MRRLAALIFDGFEMLDLFGPLEFYSFFPEEFEIVTVGPSEAPQKSSGGPSVMPEATFADGRDYDLLLIPGGMGVRVARRDPAMLGWLAHAASSAKLVTTVCTGSVLLARSGVLDGVKATSNKLAMDWAEQDVPAVNWQRSARWVEDGRFVTSSGVSAGMDMTLAVIARLLGDKAAKDAAFWAEYLPNTDKTNDPFAPKGGPHT